MNRRRPKYAIEPLKQKPFRLSSRYQCQLVASRLLTLAGVRPKYRPVRVDCWQELINDTWCWAFDQTVIVARSHDLTIILTTDHGVTVNNQEVSPFSMSTTRHLHSLELSSKCVPMKGLKNIATLALTQPVSAIWHSLPHDSLVCSINNEWFCPQCDRRFSTLESLAIHANLHPPVRLKKVWETNLGKPVGPVTRDWRQQPGWALSRPVDKHRLHNALLRHFVNSR